MPESAPALLRVLCATDLSELGNRAIAYALQVAAPGAQVTLLHVLETPGVPSPLVPRYGEKRASDDELDAQERELEARLEAIARPAAAARDLSFEARVVRGAHVASAIVEAAKRLDADLICLATHCRSGLAALALGSAAQDVLHRAGRPVLLIPSPLG